MAGFAVMHESQEEYDAKIREKAIEEFAEACKNHIFCQTFGLHPKTIDEIARELKGE